ncbi:hypothetical protein BX589_14311 [Paraburkholderia fungorum]|jgi:hypothetical protein|uniref:hypothetical protein n=1 Tax=Paraburkholderia fungorum TaxID=134537 RepID=UPI000D05914C|nr:hypothetical protein [Paraburkholderia fungorum]PRZ44844.1 hypothetical protein BX589_14311 [Paraburkholderia fungorum]
MSAPHPAGSRDEKVMKENFAYSNRRHEAALEADRRNNRRELCAASAMIGVLAAGAVSPDFARWMLNHASTILLGSIVAWAVWQSSQCQRDA